MSVLLVLNASNDDASPLGDCIYLATAAAEVDVLSFPAGKGGS
jgi:hypothetical protein